MAKLITCGILASVTFATPSVADARDRSSLPADMRARNDEQSHTIRVDPDNPPSNPYGGAGLASVLPGRKYAGYRHAVLPRGLTKGDYCSIDTKKQGGSCLRGRKIAKLDPALMAAAGHPSD